MYQTILDCYVWSHLRVQDECNQNDLGQSHHAISPEA